MSAECRAPHCWSEYGTPCGSCPLEGELRERGRELAAACRAGVLPVSVIEALNRGRAKLGWPLIPVGL